MNSSRTGQNTLTHRDAALTLLLGSASLTLYIRTLAPSLLRGDSAEFQTIAWTLGIGHPTGYPVYILLGRLFTFLPIGEVAYRVNLLSAVCGAVTTALIYLIARKLGAAVVPAIYGSLALALTPIFWKHASIAEIYTPSAACLAFVLLSVVEWEGRKISHWLMIAGLFGGLSLGIHTTVALAAPAVLVYLLAFPPLQGEGLWVRARSASLGGLAGLLIFFSSFLLLDLRDSPAGYYNTVVRPSLSVWDMIPADFDSTPERFAFLYFPPQFKGQFFNVPFDESMSRIKDFAEQASWSLWLALLGFISLFIPRKDSPSRWREAILLILAFSTFLVFASTYNVYDYYVYFIPAIVILVIFVGLGVHAIIEVVISIPRLPELVPIGLSIAILVLGFYPSLDKVTFHWRERIPPGLENWEQGSFKHPEAARFAAERIVDSLEDNAILFTDWDQVYGFYYTAHILQGRTGMSFHETQPQEGVQRLADSAIAYIEANIEARPVYFSERPIQLAGRYRLSRTAAGLFRIER